MTATNGDVEAGAFERHRLKANDVSLRHVIFQGVSYVAPAADVAAFLTLTVLFAGGSAPLAVILGGLTYASFLNMSYQFSRHTGSAAGYYGFIAKTFGGTAGAITGLWWIWFQFFSLAAFGFILSAEFIYFAFPTLSSIPYLWIPIVLVFSGITMYLGYRGLKPSLQYALGSGLLEVVFLLVASAVIIIKVGTGNTLAPFTLGPLGGNFSALIFSLLFATPLFAGSGTVVSLAEETKGTVRTIRLAIIFSVLIMIVTLVISSYALTVGWGIANMGAFALSNDPGVTVYRNYLGGIGAAILIIVTINSFLNSNVSLMSSVSRNIYALGRDRILPSAVSKLHPKFGSPYIGVFVLEGVALFLAILSGVIYGPFFGATVLFTINIFGLMGVFFIANIALPIFMKRKTGHVNILTHIIIPAVSIILIGYIFFNSMIPLPEYPLNYAVIIGLVYLPVSALTVIIYRLRNKHAFEDVGKVDVVSVSQSK